jgi:hypothetical protein
MFSRLIPILIAAALAMPGSVSHAGSSGVYKHSHYGLKYSRGAQRRAAIARAKAKREIAEREDLNNRIGQNLQGAADQGKKALEASLPKH